MATFYDDDQYRRSFFPAAYAGTNLAPSPRTGTYFNPARYAGAPYSVQRSAARNLSTAYNQDLAFNIRANPRRASELTTQAALARTGGSAFDPRTGEGFTAAGYKQPRNLTWYKLPGGGQVGLPPSAKRPSMATGVVGAERLSPQDAYNLGFSGQPAFTPKSAYERSYLAGYNVPSVERPQPTLGYQLGQALRTGATTFSNYVASLFGQPRDYFATQ